MKATLGLTACTLLLLGSALPAQARGGHGIAVRAAGDPVIPFGTTVGAQTLINGGSLTNNGTIAGGTHTAVTSTGPNPVTITNNGTITSSTGGITTTGNSSSTIVNNGTIDISNTVTSTNGHATATVGSGISQTVGP